MNGAPRIGTSAVTHSPWDGLSASETHYSPLAMPAVLFIKTSSLGDVIHQMPAITDARANLPADARIRASTR
jgi:hypothetical protein